jgi:predicted transcriptional regulator
MSDAFPMRALDKIDVRISLKADIAVRIDRVAKTADVSRAAIITQYLETMLARDGVDLTAGDQRKVKEIIKGNRHKREARIAKLRGGVR